MGDFKYWKPVRLFLVSPQPLASEAARCLCLLSICEGRLGFQSGCWRAAQSAEAWCYSKKNYGHIDASHHGLRTPSEEIPLTARLKIKSQSQIYRYGQSIFCLPHQPKVSGFFDLRLHWVSIVRSSHCYFIRLNPKRKGFF